MDISALLLKFVCIEGEVRKMPTRTLTYLERNTITGEEEYTQNANFLLMFQILFCFFKKCNLKVEAALSGSY